jgi:hypothetical protein
LGVAFDHRQRDDIQKLKAVIDGARPAPVTTTG